MAAIDTSGQDSGKKGPGVKKPKKASTNIDMTPMVDLGFLLITFFIFTATMNQPTAMKLAVPKDEKDNKDKTEVDVNGVLNILLDDDKAFVYQGDDPTLAGNMKAIPFNKVRDEILKKKQQTKDANIAEKFVVLIKAGKDSKYENTVDMLDEMTINEVDRYALTDMSPDEYTLINK